MKHAHSFTLDKRNRKLHGNNYHVPENFRINYGIVVLADRRLYFELMKSLMQPSNKLIAFNKIIPILHQTRCEQVTQTEEINVQI